MKKLISLILVAGLLTVALSAMATATNDESAVPSPLPYYLSVTGTVDSVEKLEDQEGWIRVNIKDADGNPAALNLKDNTVYPFESELAVGDTVTGYYLANAPTILIMPPQYNISVLVAGMPNDNNVKVDRFYAWEDNADGFLLSQAGTFAFRVNEDTEIILANGDDFSDGDYIGRRIVAIYNASTKSNPELATATKLIVLYEDAVPLPGPIPELNQNIDATGWPIVVDDTQIEAPAAFQTDDGIVMVPLRVIAETLGYEVIWNTGTRSVTLNEKILISIGDTDYQIANEEDVETIEAPAPILKDGFTYVPLKFFRDILKLPNAFAFEGRIEINSTGEEME